MARYSVTASAGLFVRRTPDSSSSQNILGKAARDATVEALEFNADKTWLRGKVTTVDKGEQTGWLFARWLKLLEEGSTPPGKPLAWRLGTNMREFAYYGTNAMPFTDAGLRERQLTAAQNVGVKVIRFWASHRQFDTQASINQIRAALDVIRQFKMQAVICLEDGLTGAGFFIPGDDAFHTEAQIGQLHKNYWLQERYKVNYLPHAQKIVTAFKNHDAVLMWELGNEFALHPQPAPEVKAAVAFRQFAQTVSKAIKDIAPNHLVGTGLVHHNHVHSPFEDRRAAARELYGMPTIDAVSLHFYQNDAEFDQMAIDIEIAKSLNKLIYVGEVGMKTETGDRVTFLDTQIKTKRKEGSFMVMPWNLDASPNDVGIGDLFAFSRRHPDFDAILNTMKANAS